MEKILGIDLGTSTSCVAVVVNGKPTVLPDKSGVKIQPSIVNFQHNGKILVGIEAKPYLIQDAQNTISSSKRLIGRKYVSAEVKKAQALMPYKIIEGENQSVAIEIHGTMYSLQEISAMILKKMKSIAEEYFGEPITKAVITVPAYFNDNQRAATMDAGKLAGLEVLRIINEPTAAALAYGYGQNAKQRVALYDFGGGTFDISILELGEGVFEVVSTAGDTYLGGDDLEERVITWVTTQFQKEHNVDLKQNKQTLQKLKDACEKAKIELSTQTQAKIFIPAIHSNASGFLDIDLTLTRDKYNELVEDLIQKTFQVCDEAMQMARFTPADLDGVILVGGPSRTPGLRQAVQHYFQMEPNTNINPEEVVAVGAALQASALTGETKDIVLIDLTPLSLGIEIKGGLIDRIIDINTPVPVDHTKIFATAKDDQESVVIRVFQGEGKKAVENELLGELTLSGLRKAPAGEVNVAITFEINTDGILHVSAKDIETGKTQTVKLRSSGRMSDEKMNQLQQKLS